MFELEKLLRPNIKRLVPYSSARDEFHGEARIFIDANENSLGSPLQKAYNRYPDPLQWKLKEAISKVKGVPPQNMFLGNGSDECIDILYRAFCNPGRDNVILNPPTYGMYEVSAHINDIELRKARLLDNFQLNLEKIESLIDDRTKIIWICSPNNPTSNSMQRADIEMILN
ncbi:MAG: aminotransferase class I/II-fold pyridoxal phosphate-dependent enzyme, partial [Chitinophagales bacterium]